MQTKAHEKEKYMIERRDWEKVKQSGKEKKPNCLSIECIHLAFYTMWMYLFALFPICELELYDSIDEPQYNILLF